MAAQAETCPTSPKRDAGETQPGLSRPAAIVLPMPRLGVSGQAMIDHAAGGRLSPARGIMLGIGAGVALWAGLLSLAWHTFH